MRIVLAVLVAVVLAPALGPAAAGDVLDRMRAQDRIRCGAVERPGLLDLGHGQARGLFADLCRALGVAVLGPAAKIELRAYGSDQSFDAVRSGTDDVFFLSGAELLGNHLDGAVLPGPTVFVASTAVMVEATSPARDLPDLHGEPICFEQGTASHRHLEAWFAAHQTPFLRMGYQEPDEMTDAFDSGRCHALAGEATALAAFRAAGDTPRRGRRLLPTPLARFPLMAATGLGDARWSATVALAVASLMLADELPASWRSAGLDGLRLSPVPELPPDWQTVMVSATGSYGAMIRRNLGDLSPLRLATHANALADQGGTFMPLSDH